MELKCQWCGKTYQAVRRSSKFCSDSCKTQNHRYNPSAQCNEHFKAAIYHIKKLEELGNMDSDVTDSVIDLLLRVSARSASMSREVTIYRDTKQLYKRGNTHLYEHPLIHG